MTRRASLKPHIRPACIDDLTGVDSLQRQCQAQAGSTRSAMPYVFPHKTRNCQSILQERILDHCLLVAEQQGQLIAAAGLDLERGGLAELLLSRQADRDGVFELLVAAAERLAIRFGIDVIGIRLPHSAAGRFRSLGFTEPAGPATAQESDCPVPMLSMQRSLRRRQTAYGRRVRALGRELGLPPTYGRRHRLALQPEATRLSSIGADVFGREQKLTPRAAAAWRRMRRTAMADAVELQPVSGWRSVNYQSDVLRRKLEKGLTMEEILRTSAAPGYSEHHTGRAIDITTPGYAALEEEFEHSGAFHWLQSHAQDFGFRLSFPRDNRHSLAYEPWHWYFTN